MDQELEALRKEARERFGSSVEPTLPSMPPVSPLKPTEDPELLALREEAKAQFTPPEPESERGWGEAAWARTIGRPVEAWKSVSKASEEFAEGKPSWGAAGRGALGAAELVGTAAAPVATAGLAALGTVAEKVTGSKELGDVAEMVVGVAPAARGVVRGIKRWAVGMKPTEEITAGLASGEGGVIGYKKMKETLLGKGYTDKEAEAALKQAEVFPTTPESTAIEAGELLKRPGRGASAAIKQVDNETTRLYAIAEEGAKAADVRVPLSKGKEIVQKIREAKQESASGGIGMYFGRKGQEYPARVAASLQRIEYAANRGKIPVADLIQEQSRLRKAMRKLPIDHPGREGIKELDALIDDTLSNATEGTDIYEALETARDYYRGVAVPTRRSATKILKTETPEEAAHAAGRLPSRFKRVVSADANAAEQVRRTYFQKMLVDASDEGEVNLGKLADVLYKAEKSGLLKEIIKNDEPRKRTIEVIKRAHKLQKGLSSIIPGEVTTGLAVGLGGGGLWGGGAAAVGARILAHSAQSGNMSKLLLRWAKARQGTPGAEATLKHIRSAHEKWLQRYPAIAAGGKTAEVARREMENE